MVPLPFSFNASHFILRLLGGTFSYYKKMLLLERTLLIGWENHSFSNTQGRLAKVAQVVTSVSQGGGVGGSQLLLSSRSD